MNAIVRTLPAAFREEGLQQQSQLPQWLRQLRAPSLEQLGELPLPTRKTESWRYSSRHLMLDERQAASAAAIDVPVLRTEDYVAHFGNGRFHAEASHLPDEPGVSCLPFSAISGDALANLQQRLNAQLDEAKLPFAPLLKGRMQDGLYVRLSAGAKLSRALHIRHVSGGAAGSSFPRLVVDMGTGSELTLVEEFVGSTADTGLTGAVAEITVGDNARLTHLRLSMEEETQSHLGASCIALGRSAVLESHSISLGGPLRRHDLRVLLQQAGAECTVNGVYLTREEQHHDTQLTIEHIAPHCTSRETWRGIAGGNSHAVFNGRILIHRDAQKSSAELSNKNLLLNSGAEINTKPELEIYADDVKCAHGATVGQLDHASLFYLVSRGIDSQQARLLLSLAFVQELVNQLPLEEVRAVVSARLSTVIEQAFAGGA